MCVNALSGLYLISTKRKPGKEDLCPSLVSMPSRAYTSFLRYPLDLSRTPRQLKVSMPSRAYTSFLLYDITCKDPNKGYVSMPSRAYTSFLHSRWLIRLLLMTMCQCPLGLIPHFYGIPSKT